MRSALVPWLKRDVAEEVQNCQAKLVALEHNAPRNTGPTDGILP